MKLPKIASALFLLLGLTCTGSQDKPTIDSPRGKIDSIVFLNSNHGFIQTVQSPSMVTYETQDAGKTWKQIGRGAFGFRGGRSFATPLKGWSIKEGLWPKGEIYKTADGGQTWQVSFKSTNTQEFVFGEVQAISEDEVWAVGTHAYHTTDGGKTWRLSGPGGTVVQFLGSQLGWISGEKLWQTDDGGENWQPVVTDGKPCFGGLGFFFLNNQRGWSVSGKTEGNIEGGAETGYVIGTSDGGMTCLTLAQLPGHYLWSVFFLNQNEGWVGGVGSLLKTEDGGRTWTDIYESATTAGRTAQMK